MKKVLFIFTVLVSDLALGVKATGVSNTQNPVNCNLRLSNERITNGTPSDGQQFCVGSVISNSVLVTSAHCMNQVTTQRIPNLNNIPEGVRIRIAPFSETGSFDAEILPGARSAVYDEEMATHNLRADYLDQRDTNMTKSDVVIIKLKNAVLPYNANCPQLPTAEECAEFDTFANAPVGPSKSYDALAATFYRSSYYPGSGGHLSQDTPYPSSSMVNGAPSELMRNVRGYYRVEFRNPVLRFEVGDSGSGLLLQKSQTRKIIVGTQSAKTSTEGQALFSALCRLVGRPNYPLN